MKHCFVPKPIPLPEKTKPVAWSTMCFQAEAELKTLQLSARITEETDGKSTCQNSAGQVKTFSHFIIGRTNSDSVQRLSSASLTSVFFFFPTGITLPSAFSAIYFLLFIGVCTWWACHLPISHLGFNALCVMVGFFTSGHLVCLYLYQSLLAQALFPPHSLWAR